MIEFTVHLSLKEYQKANYTILYKRPLAIIVTSLGVLFMCLAIAGFLFSFWLSSQDPLVNFILGFCWCTYLPLSVYFRSKKVFASNKLMQEEVKWTVDEDSIKLQGQTYKSEFNWPGINRIQLLKDFMIIYMSKSTMYIIPRKSFHTDEEAQRLLEIAKKNNIPVIG